ncbi:hypothetical protein E4T56_gene11632 [Termitomyces sp. T112]|nr:hypothetical protein E4T56_gene11632 [Termitomyces sp. T112]
MLRLTSSSSKVSYRETELITDNELRRYLVDLMPIEGSIRSMSLCICHSASLLNLEHTQCNQVYVPWMSKGKRRSGSRLSGNDYRNDVWFELPVIVLHNTVILSP